MDLRQSDGAFLELLLKWIAFTVLALLFFVRIFVLKRFYVVGVGLGIYFLECALAFFVEYTFLRPVLPITINRRIRRDYWYNMTIATLLAHVLTLFPVFDSWPWLFVFLPFTFRKCIWGVITQRRILRLKARRLENEIDAKLAPFGRLDHSGEEIEAEIERLLHNLQQTNSSMQSLMSALGSDIVSHTLTRHSNIYEDFVQEFRRKRATAKNNREHAELFHSYGSPVQRNVEADPLIQERSSVQSSTAQIDSVIGQAQATLSVLSTQRNLFGNIGFKINSLGAFLPTVSHTIAAIRRKKSQDTLILSAVISICTFLLFVYWISK